MKTGDTILAERAEAYRATAAAYEADPANALYLEQVRRDVEIARRWLAKQSKES